jgi:hypothetical protein
MAEPFASPAASQRESFLAIESFDALMIGRNSLALQHSMQHRASPTAMVLGQCAQPLPQLLVMIQPGFVTKRASRDPDQPAGATLREMMVRYHFRHHLSLHRGP